jgi:hypothetical protein
MLGISLAQRDLAGLLDPLEYGQGAPMLFVLGSKLLTMVAGFHGMTLRLIPLITGCLFLPLFWRVATRLLPPRGALVALFLVATSRALVYYSNEFKPYAIDALLALVAFGIGHAGVTLGWTKSRLAALATLGVLGPWLAWPVLFLYAGMTPVLMWYAWRGHDGRSSEGWGGVGRVAAVGLLCLASFSAQYAIFMAHLTDDTHTFDYWRGRGAFGPGFAIWQDPGWAFRVLVWLCWHPEGLGFWPPNYTGYLWWAPAVWVLGPAVVIAGLVWLFRQRRPVFWFALLPALVVLAAANFGKYPFGERLVLFLLPGLFLACGAAASWGTGEAATRPGRGRIRIGRTTAAAVVFCGLFSLGMVRDDLVHGQTREEIRDVLRPIRARADAGETASIWAYHFCRPAIFCHHRANPLEVPDPALIRFGTPLKDESAPSVAAHFAANGRQAGGKVWLVATHIYGDAPEAIGKALAEEGTVHETLAPVDGRGLTTGAWAWLFESGE